MKCYTLEYKEVTDVIIIPTDVLQDIISLAGFIDCITVDCTIFIPVNYAAYLVQVIQINRHLKEFAFCYLTENTIKITDIYEIAKRQFMQLTFDTQYCFQKVELLPSLSCKINFYLEYATPFIDVCQDKNVYFQYKRTKFFSKIFNYTH